MENCGSGVDKTTIVIIMLCRYFQIQMNELERFLKRKENKYLLLLLLKNYRCLNKEKIKEMFNIITDKSINYNLGKAEEKFFINKEFRERYFEIEEGLKNII